MNVLSAVFVLLVQFIKRIMQLLHLWQRTS